MRKYEVTLVHGAAGVCSEVVITVTLERTGDSFTCSSLGSLSPAKRYRAVSEAEALDLFLAEEVEAIRRLGITARVTNTIRL